MSLTAGVDLLFRVEWLKGPVKSNRKLSFPFESGIWLPNTVEFEVSELQMAAFLASVWTF